MQLDIVDSYGVTMPLYLWGHCALLAKTMKLKYGDSVTCANVTVSFNQQIGKLQLQCGINSKLHINLEECE